VAHACNPNCSGEEIRRAVVQSQPGKMVHKTLSRKTLSQKIGLVEWLKVKAWSSNPSPTKTKHLNKNPKRTRYHNITQDRVSAHCSAFLRTLGHVGGSWVWEGQCWMRTCRPVCGDEDHGLRGAGPIVGGLWQEGRLLGLWSVQLCCGGHRLPHSCGDKENHTESGVHPC
jgi:hypothetical protein